MSDGTDTVSGSDVGRACAEPPTRTAATTTLPASPVTSRRIANLVVSHPESSANWQKVQETPVRSGVDRGGAALPRPKPKGMRGGRITAAVVLAAGALVV